MMALYYLLVSEQLYVSFLSFCDILCKGLAVWGWVGSCEDYFYSLLFHSNIMFVYINATLKRMKCYTVVAVCLS